MSQEVHHVRQSYPSNRHPIPVGRSVNGSVNHSVNRLVNRLVNRFVNRFACDAESRRDRRGK
jgi:putative methionine-R-sulfoxide reductase with GAF domain